MKMFPTYYTNLDELENRLKTFSYRVRKKDCLDLPDKVYVQRYIELTDEQKQMYSDLKRKAMTIIHDETVSFNNKLTEVLRLHQITCGFLNTDSGEIHEFKNNLIIRLPKVNLEIVFIYSTAKYYNY
jgi:SNF2 family DNA or RNA helicase